MNIKRKGKGRAAQGSQAKPPNQIKKQTFKTANGRRVFDRLVSQRIKRA